MSARVQWDPKYPGERVIRSADFTDQLVPEEVVASLAVSVSVWSGNDPNPSSIFLASSIQNNSAGVAAVAWITLTGGVTGTLYAVVVAATTNLANVYEKNAYLAVVSNLP